MQEYQDNPDDQTPDNQNIENEELVTVWGVRRKLVGAYFWLFSLLFTLVSGAVAWREWANAAAGTYLVDILLVALGVASGKVLWLAAFSIITVEVGYMIAEHYIVNRYKKGLSKGRSEGLLKGRSEGLSKGRSEGLSKGRQDQHQQWLAWYERQQAAHREGRPFTEPPPAGPQGENGNGI